MTDITERLVPLEGVASSEPDKPSLRETVAELAAMDYVDYLERQKSVAKRYGIAARELDRLVKAERRGYGDAEGTVEDASPPVPDGRLVLERPKPWPDPVDGGPLLDEIRDAVLRHVSLSDCASEAIALWLLHTYLFDAWGVSPRLLVTSPEKGCGKTTLVDVIRQVACKPLVGSNATPSILFRVIERVQPTLILDEADTFLRGSEEMRGILNSSHSKATSFVLRSVPKGDDYEEGVFSTWCPMALAGIGRLFDTLEDRSIIITLQRKPRDTAVEQVDDAARARLAELSRKAARWSQDRLAALKTRRPDLPSELFNRTADNWRPLIAIADEAGSHWPTTARRVAVRFVSRRDDQSARVQLLDDIWSIFEDKGSDRLASSFIVEALVEMEDRPWPEWRHGKPLTTTSLSRLLKPFEIFPRGVRIGDRTPKGYLKEQFEDAVQRYGKGENPLDPPFQTATPQQISEINDLRRNQTATRPDDVAGWSPDNSLKNNDCCGVADGNGGVGPVSPKPPETDVGDIPAFHDRRPKPRTRL